MSKKYFDTLGTLMNEMTPDVLSSIIDGLEFQKTPQFDAVTANVKHEDGFWYFVVPARNDTYLLLTVAPDGSHTRDHDLRFSRNGLDDRGPDGLRHLLEAEAARKLSALRSLAS